MILSFGDSFIYGSELPDCCGHPSQLTWPSLIAQDHNEEYECHAVPGCGNLLILQKISEHAHRDALFIINWTWIDRFDYTDAAHGHWYTLRPSMQEPNSEQYFKNLQSLDRDLLTSLCYISTAIQILRNHNRSFLMTYMDPDLFRTWHNPTVTLLQQQVRNFLHDYGGYTFLQWAQRNQYPVTEKLHPKKEAHENASVYWTDLVDTIFFDRQNIVGC